MTIETKYNNWDEVWRESLVVPNMINIQCFTIEVNKEKAPLDTICWYGQKGVSLSSIRADAFP